MFKVDYNPDVLSCLANLSSDEVFTPPALANEILDMLPKELWSNKEITFLDPVSKSGVFLREIAKRLIVGLDDEIPDMQTRVNHILKNQLFGIAITELTSLLSRRSLYCSKTANGKYSICNEFDTESGNILFDKIQHTWKNGKCEYCNASRDVYDREDIFESHAYQFIHTNKPEELFNMKFDVIIGNPPYQLSDGGHGISAKPIFHLFVQQAKKLNPRYLSMIIPARWYAGGKGLDEFRNEMLNCKNIRTIVDFESSKECFEAVNIAGGICYFLWDKSYRGDCRVVNSNNDFELNRPLNEYPIFIRDNRSISILKKVTAKRKISLRKYTFPRNPFGFATFERGEDKPFKDSISLLSSKGFGYVYNQNIKKNREIINKYKVLIGRLVPSNGELDVNPEDGYRVITNTRIIKPGEINTESYLVLGAFDSKQEVENFNNFINLKFPRFLIRQSISSVNVTRDCFKFVPYEDFTRIWTDEELYNKYNLSQLEIDFIESNIRAVV